MDSRTLSHEEWGAYFAPSLLPNAHLGGAGDDVLQLASVKSDGPPAKLHLRVRELIYDESDELFEVVAPGYRHFVLRPDVVRVNEVEGRLRRLEFVFPNGAHEILYLA